VPTFEPPGRGASWVPLRLAEPAAGGRPHLWQQDGACAVLAAVDRPLL